MKEPKVIERFADNGEHSHWQLIDENGEILWSEEPTEVKNNAVLPLVSNRRELLIAFAQWLAHEKEYGKDGAIGTVDAYLESN